MNPLVKFSAVRKQQAEQVLTGGDVIKTLSRYGSPLIVGSYALDVMYDPDIDIVVLTKNPWKSSLDALHDFISQRKFQKYEYGDFVKFRRPGNPEGFIVNLRTKTSTISWEVEIWFLKSITRDKTFTTALLEKLDTKKRLKILGLKHERATKKLSKHDLSSMEIYRRVVKNTS